MAPSSLLGPPEIHLQPPESSADSPEIHLQPPESPADSSGDPFMANNFNTTEVLKEPPMGFTENCSPTFLSTGNPCLDFFFHVVPDTPPENLTHRLELAWKHDALTSLKLICNLRGVRGTGKSDKEGFYTAALWLHKNHPKTLACNVRWFADFGYFKDLPEILFRLLKGLDVRKISKDERMRSSKGGKSKSRTKLFHNNNRRTSEQRVKSTIPQEERIATEMKNVKIEMEKARESRKKKIASMARQAVERYSQDPDYRFLHDRISELFAEFLISDLQFLNLGEIGKISLASKWCPSVDSSFDRSTLLCESIARRVFPRESYPEYEGIEEAHYAYRVRDRLRKEFLVPLHQALELPEVYMTSNRWDSLPYDRVASVAMKTYKKLFKKHDESRFQEFLENVKRGEAKIAAGALLPHEILNSLHDEDGSEVAELQWRRMVEDLSKKGKLRNCLAICDVSWSMEGTPMEVCVALGLLISDLSEDPWKGKVITFSHDPQLHKIEGDNLLLKTEFVRKMDWGMNTDFQKVFDLILQVAINGNLEEDKMIKRVFVFSDMEFDEASLNDWETDYRVIQRKFQESGYESSIPEIVFWNLRDSKATPVPSLQKGVALVSGFSKNLLTLFLDGGGIVNPEAVMEMAISGSRYKKLTLLD